MLYAPKRTYHLTATDRVPHGPLCRTWEAVHAPHQVWIHDPERVTCSACLELMKEGDAA